MNDNDIYCLVKEEVDYDPTKTETLKVMLKINENVIVSSPMTWIVEDFEDKVQTALGMGHL